MKNRLLTLCLLTVSLVLVGCTTPQTDECQLTVKPPLQSAMLVVEDKLNTGCVYGFEGYMSDLLQLAVDNPAPENKRAFSDFLVRISDDGVISKRQAKSLYNRYFNIKFVSLTGDYNTCSQVCPTRNRVLADMRLELLDKETGLVKASSDATAYYRADQLLQEAELVLEATCRACENGGR